MTSALPPRASEGLSTSEPLECNTVCQVEDAELPNPRNRRAPSELDNLDHESRRGVELVEALRPYQLDLEHPKREVHLESNLIPEQRIELEHFLTKYKDVFA
ncbi:hypothetical protein TorRG33x02_331730 [Trema orientale]|uniref:Uncharacterized protein n=1 Tax=Trema orientale TaxID=63057 RepID=A0A2P5B5S8_TREOI|nr:hypothetical protein TorRG33x02_331730 [Trema orientale]